MEYLESVYAEGIQISYEASKLTKEEFVQLFNLMCGDSNKDIANANVLSISLKVYIFIKKYKVFPPKFIELSQFGQFINKSMLIGYQEYGEINEQTKKI